ncbi:protein-glutamate methylesterase/protein-glutamine glutaminase [Virgisporangium ochraceum]|uniref:Protein-glutamate methylesterase/protein-glutamine glutaminase n=1 Tax=Virgisporangium ochraceum TaxID=65505 RepID=A0A8J3ZTY0_9ACTN|nr:chemotaxis response regulator protein-glutamate methylesterase [Virgisporangium ochraceum]GIJ69839.1 chemotaxis response regulator protein-glutamate methylesterase 3 [Virgisporangium ochraceum]
MISVLVVDDSVVVRRLITDALADDPKINVVGTAPNGKVALQKIEQLKPDLVTLDIEMPVMDGLTTLRELRKKHRALPVIMFSTLTANGAAATLDALSAGASDYVTKPANVGSVSESIRSVREQLIPRIHALTGRRSGPPGPPGGGPGRPPPGAPPRAPAYPSRPGPAAVRTPPPGAPAGAPVRPGALNRPPASVTAATGPATAGPGRPAAAPRGGGKIEVLAVGCSTGGPDALTRVMSRLPGSFPVPVVVVQHMPPVFTKMFAERLDRNCPLTVVEATGDMPLEAGTVYIAPGDFHMEIQRQGTVVATKLHTGPPENFCRPAVDVLFRSVNRVYGKSTLAVILTGMGHDGREGCSHLARSGAEIVAQDEATSVVWGMPGAVTNAGLASVVLPLDDISNHVMTRVNGGRTARSMEVIR